MAFVRETEMQQKTQQVRSDFTMGAVDAASMVCTKCGSQDVMAKAISTAFWTGMDLRVIRDIPALVCQSCGEEFISDHTAMTIDMMRGGGLRPSEAETHIQVPVFSFPASAKAEKGA